MSTIKILVRNNSTEESEILSDTEFMSTALDQMSSTAISLKDCNEADILLNGMADIIELMQEVLMKHNIAPTYALQKAYELREQNGSFQDKKAVIK